jgi:hypothetical protein
MAPGADLLAVVVVRVPEANQHLGDMGNVVLSTREPQSLTQDQEMDGFG